MERPVSGRLVATESVELIVVQCSSLSVLLRNHPSETLSLDCSPEDFGKLFTSCAMNEN